MCLSGVKRDIVVVVVAGAPKRIRGMLLECFFLIHISSENLPVVSASRSVYFIHCGGSKIKPTPLHSKLN